MRFKCIFLFFFCLSLFSSQGYSQHQIKVNYPSAADSSLLLVCYLNNKLIVCDTLKMNHLGEYNIQGNKNLNEGIYSLVLNQKRFDFLVGKNQFFSINITSDSSFPIICNNKESEAFMNYQSFLIKMQKNRTTLLYQLQKKPQNPDSALLIKQKLKVQDTEMVHFWKEKIKMFKGTMTGIFFQSLLTPEEPDFHIAANGIHRDSILWVKRYNYYQQYFTNNFPLHDPRVLRTPVFYSRLKNFIENQTIQTPDSVIATAFRIINHCAEATKKTVLNDILDLTLNSQTMGMDAAFVTIAEKYYIRQNLFSSDTTTLNTVKEQIELHKSNLLGNIAPDLKLPSLEEENDYRLSETNARYVILVFWEPECGFCKTEIPKLHDEIYLPLKNKGIKVFAVNIATNHTQWENFINQHKLNDWINVYDPNRTSNYWKLYNITSTPVIYVLNESKQIIAKHIDINTLKSLLNQWVKQQ